MKNKCQYGKTECGCVLKMLSQESIPNIFDCNLKTNCQILIIFGDIFFWDTMYIIS